jgi:hypothetical protein
VTQKIAFAEAAKIPAGHDPNTYVYRGTRPHHVNVIQRKSLLAFLLVRAQIDLTQTQLENWWQSMVVNAVSDWERSMCFSWWQVPFYLFSSASLLTL